MKRIASLMAILMMVLTLVPCSSFASEKTISTFESYVNPVYQDVITESDLKKSSETGISMYSRSRYFTEETEVIDALREAMTYRQENITIKYLLPEEIPNGYLDRWMEQACAETGNPKQGDYLRWHLAGAASVGSGFIDENGYNYTFDITVTYYTTAEQEEVVDQTVANLIMKLGISDTMSDYEKLCAVYDYVCETVTYDYTNLNDTTYTLKFSAYAALVDNTAVCQGYSNLMYRLMREMGISSRIITGTGNGGPHAWNIVKLRDKYYLFDSTWDAGRSPYNYFLRGSEEFWKSHTTGDEYLTDEFTAAYPVSETDYSICDHQWEVEYTIDADPTCETTGSKSYHCELCDEIQATSKVVIPAIGHIYETVVTAPTCTTEGYTTHTCSRCDDSYVADEVKALGHAFGEFITTTKAKFGKNGEKIAICADCEETITKPIAAPKTVKLSYGSYTYDGKVKSPLVTVYDSNGKKVSSSNYSVAYASGRKNVGKYKVTVTMKNSSTDYEKSSKYTTFKINPKGVSVSKLTKGKKSLKVTWKKPTSTYRKQMSGYQIRYSTKSSMASAKIVTVKSTTATSKTIKKLKAKKKYYVQIRTYKTVSGTKYYSAWSSKKSVTTK